MKKNIKKYQRVLLLLFLLLLLFFAFKMFFQNRDYEVSYQVDDFLIKEAYHHDFDYYSFVFQKEDQVYYAFIDNHDFSARKVVKEIDEKTLEQESCILPKSNYVRFDYLCRVGDEQVSYHLVSDQMKKEISLEDFSETTLLKKEKNMEIYSGVLDDIFVWNYRGFYVIHDQTFEEITLFSKDVYQPSFITQVENVLVIPDYEAEYYFEKVYLLDMNTKKVQTWNLNEKVYFDSRVLGVYQGCLYFVDKHEQKEWKLNISKKKIERVGNQNMGIIYQHGFQDISMNKLIYQDVSFEGLQAVDYKKENHSFYRTWNDYSMKILDDEITEVVGIKQDTVYYLKGDTLYSYSEYLGERILLRYFEWNFNHSNVIFVF